jgi:uncharacterized protein YecE (DUF72 family)
MPDQLGLFPTPEGDPRLPRHGHAVHDGGSAALAGRFERLRPVAAALPATIYMGTSSWSFPGWAGIVYPAKATESRLSREGLRDYARHPLLRTVGIDRSYYAPVPADDLTRYASQLPPGFPCCAKAPAVVSSPFSGTRDRITENEFFLSPETFVDTTLRTFASAFADHAGPFIVQVSPSPRGRRLPPETFTERLDGFLARLPREFRYAVEVRERALLTDSYRAVLARHGAAHVYNYWSAMPLPGEQAEFVPPDSQPFVVVRLLLKPGTWYENQRDLMAPFDRLVAVDEAMREDVVGIMARTIGLAKEGFLLVNNKAEGSSPLTIEAIAAELATKLAEGA